MLEDPKVNLAISTRSGWAGVDHVGVQAETGAELAEIAQRLKAAGETTVDQAGATCCYARSDKTWVRDPSGVKWETFFTFGQSTAYGEDDVPAPEAHADPATAGRGTGACC